MTLCRYCGNRPACRPKGLCAACSYTPAIRERVPSLSKFAPRLFAVQGPPPDAPPPEPVTLTPGSEAKLRVLIARAHARQELWAAGDRPHPEELTYAARLAADADGGDADVTVTARAGYWRGYRRKYSGGPCASCGGRVSNRFAATVCRRCTRTDVANEVTELYLAGLSVNEIADRLVVSRQRVSLLLRAVRGLRVMLGVRVPRKG